MSTKRSIPDFSNGVMVVRNVHRASLHQDSVGAQEAHREQSWEGTGPGWAHAQNSLAEMMSGQK